MLGQNILNLCGKGPEDYCSFEIVDCRSPIDVLSFESAKTPETIYFDFSDTYEYCISDIFAMKECYDFLESQYDFKFKETCQPEGNVQVIKQDFYPEELLYCMTLQQQKAGVDGQITFEMLQRDNPTDVWLTSEYLGQIILCSATTDSKVSDKTGEYSIVTDVSYDEASILSFAVPEISIQSNCTASLGTPTLFAEDSLPDDCTFNYNERDKTFDFKCANTAYEGVRTFTVEFPVNFRESDAKEIISSFTIQITAS